MVLLSVALGILQLPLAFVALDVLFRAMPVRPQELRRSLARYALLYAGVALLVGLAGAWVQYRLGGAPGLIAAAFNWVPWWLLWRFGLRKQFPFLFGQGEYEGPYEW